MITVVRLAHTCTHPMLLAEFLYYSTQGLYLQTYTGDHFHIFTRPRSHLNDIIHCTISISVAGTMWSVFADPVTNNVNWEVNVNRLRPIVAKSRQNTSSANSSAYLSRDLRIGAYPIALEWAVFKE